MILQAQVTLTTTPTLLVTASGRTKVTINIINFSAQGYVGDSSVSTMNGFALQTGNTEIELSDGAQLYGISNSPGGPVLSLITTN